MKLVVAAMTMAYVSVAVAQDSAKALFRDPTSSVSVQASSAVPRPTSTAQKTTAEPRPGSPVQTEAVLSSSLPEVTGLMYWVEIRSDQGQLLRVNSTRTFRSGERIRLHVTSNVDGQLAILQSQDGGPFTRLFPTRAGASGRVRKYEEQTLPSKDGWFRFDNKPGDLRLMLMVQADETAPRSGEVQLPQNRMSSAEERLLEEQMRTQIDRLRGSKALVVEEDSSAGQAATYTVVDTRKAEDVPKGLAAVEVKLTHR